MGVNRWGAEGISDRFTDGTIVESRTPEDVGESGDNVLDEVGVVEVLVQAEVTCFAEFLLCLSEVDFEGDPSFVGGGETIPEFYIVAELARLVDDVIREVDDLLGAEGCLSRVCQHRKVLHKGEDAIYRHDRIKSVRCYFFRFSRDLLRCDPAVCPEQVTDDAADGLVDCVGDGVSQAL